jgi:dCMP deaminase
MTKEEKYHQLYMDVAYRFADMSHCVRAKAGAIAVKNGNIISHGWNGRAPGLDNCCEISKVDVEGNQYLETLTDVIHAEKNMICKLAASNESSRGATVYLTLAPCIECATLLAVAKVKEVVYSEMYRVTAGIEHLIACNIPVYQITKNNKNNEV